MGIADNLIILPTRKTWKEMTKMASTSGTPGATATAALAAAGEALDRLFLAAIHQEDVAAEELRSPKLRPSAGAQIARCLDHIGHDAARMAAVDAAMTARPALVPTLWNYRAQVGQQRLDGTWRSVGGPGDLPRPYLVNFDLVEAQAQQLGAHPWTICALGLADIAKTHPEAFGESTSPEDEQRKRAQILARPKAMVDALTALPLWALVGYAAERRLDLEPRRDLAERLLAHVRARGLREPAPLPRARGVAEAGWLR